MSAALDVAQKCVARATFLSAPEAEVVERDALAEHDADAPSFSSGARVTGARVRGARVTGARLTGERITGLVPSDVFSR